MKQRLLYLITALLISVTGFQAAGQSTVPSVVPEEKEQLKEFFSANYSLFGVESVAKIWADIDSTKLAEDAWQKTCHGITVSFGGENYGHITAINWPGKGLAGNLDVSGFRALKNLNCSGNNLGLLDLSGCVAFTSLNCSNTNLTNLDLSRCAALTSLNCSNNKLTGLDVSASTDLKSLDCSNNKLTRLDVSKNMALTSLDCSSNQLTDIILSANTPLEYLSCFNNNLPPSFEAEILDLIPWLIPGKNFFFSPPPPPAGSHYITLDVAPGIDCYGLASGTQQMGDGDHLFLQFLPDDRTLGPDDVMLLVDGVDTPFSVPAAGSYYGYILNPIHGNHSIVIALREYTVTLPEVPADFTLTPAPGTHRIAYGEPFTFSLTGTFDPAVLQVFVNGLELSAASLRAAETLTLQYTLDAVTGPAEITFKGIGETGNPDIARGAIRLAIDNGQLTIDNEMSTAVDAAIYTFTGKTFVQLRALRGSRTIALPAGVYIVRAGTQSWKVIVN